MNPREVMTADAAFDGGGGRRRTVLHRLRYVLWPLVASLVVGLSLYAAMLASMDFSAWMRRVSAMIGRLTSYGPVELVPIVAVVGLALRKRRGRVRSYAPLVVTLLFLAGMALLVSLILWLETTRYNSDWARLQLYKPEYMGDIERLPAAGLHVKIWQWGHPPAPGAGTTYAVVYDDADQIIRPADQRSPAWKAAAGSWVNVAAYDSDDVSIAIRPLDRHFYLVSVVQR